MTIEVVGLGLWEEELGVAEKKKLIELELWKPSIRAKWDELGLDILLDPDQLEELQASQDKQGGKGTSGSRGDGPTKKRKKVAKKPASARKSE